MDDVKKKVAEKTKDLTSQVVDVVESVASDLKDLAKKYGSWIVMFLVVAYLWKKIK